MLLSLKHDNRGVSLFFVIVCITFIALLGSIVLSTTVQNTEMKTMEKMHKENFYDAEAALNEIKAGLTELVSDVVATAYSEVLVEYSNLNIGMRTSAFKKSYDKNIKLQLGLMNNGTQISADYMSRFLLETKYDTTKEEGAKIDGNSRLEVLSDGTGFAIRGLKVNYYMNGYSTGISTDIMILYPDNLFTDTSGPMESLPYKDYAIVANKSLKALLSNHVITGNVYSGEGGMEISSENASLTINGNLIISAGDIQVSEKADLLINSGSKNKVNGKLVEADAEIWANNIITNQLDKKEQRSIDTVITMNGRTYVKDDLTLNAKKSNVTFVGQYFGYSSGTTPDTNSAIMINATNAILNLSKLSSLSIAGRAYISLEKNNYILDNRYGVTSSNNSNVLTGESLSVKGSQSIYLVPDTYVKVGHNPVSWPEYQTYYHTGDMVVIPKDAVIFTEQSIPVEQTKLYYYLNENEPFKKVFYQFGATSNAVYYYLNFKSPELTTTYSKNYRLNYPERLETGYVVESISVNESAGALISAGNLLSYEDNFKMIYGSNGNYVYNYLGQFQNLSHTLQKYKYGTGDVFSNLIDTKKLKQDGLGKNQVALSIDTSDYFVHIVDNANETYRLDKTNRKGLIIATGDVDVNTSFTGLVMSGGTVQLYGGANLTEDHQLIQAIISGNSAVRAYFTEFKDEKNTSSSTIKKMDITDLIYYENWKKN